MLFKNVATRITSRITLNRGLVKEAEGRTDVRFLEMQSRELYNIGLWIHVQDARIIERLEILQERIKAIIGPDHFYSPLDEFHITISIFIEKDNEYGEQVLPAQRVRDLSHYEWAVAEAGVSRINLTFKGIMVTDAAICIIGDNDHVLDDARSRIKGTVEERGLEYLGAPNIVHSTLVRILDPITLEQRIRIWEAFRDFKIGELNVEELVLAHITTFGRFNSRTQSRYIVLGK